MDTIADTIVYAIVDTIADTIVDAIVDTLLVIKNEAIESNG